MNIHQPIFGALVLGMLLVNAGCSGDDDDDTPGTGGSGSSAWVGKTYKLAVPKDNWAKPRGVGTDIGRVVPEFLIQVTEGTAAGSFNILLGTANAAGTQELCNKTVVTTGTSAAPPAIQIGPVDFPLYLHNESDDQAVKIPDAMAYDFTLTNVLPDGDVASTNGILSTQVDARVIYRLFLQLTNPTPENVCAGLHDSYQVECEPCRDGQNFCLKLEAKLLGAQPASITLAPVTTTDPSCSTTP